METITMAHGNGGKMTDKLIDNIFLKYLNNDILKQKDDSSLLPEIKGKPLITTDSFVVNPIFFPGGDIGKLAVCGTVNDLAVSGAVPLYLTAGFILEEGFPVKQLEEIIKSMADTAWKANVLVVAGDTKVVEKGKGDNIYINTTGVGAIVNNNSLTDEVIKNDDKIIISGSIGEHGLTILKKRKGMNFNDSLKSDCCILSDFIKNILDKTKGVKFMRDPTRGGIATVLNEISDKYKVSIKIKEVSIPTNQEVNSLCKILGLDPLYLANEGKVLMIAAEEYSEKIVEIMRRYEQGRNACIIGSITGDKQSQVLLETKIGGKRIINKLIRDILPRIC